MPRLESSTVAVDGNLLLVDSAVTEVPDGITVTGGLSASRCAGLVRLGRVRRASVISLQDCPSLVELRGPIDARHIELQRCTRLTRLPDRVSAGVLDLTGCSALETLPRHLTAKLVRVAGCRSLRATPPWKGVDQLVADQATGLPYDWRTMFVDADTARDWIVTRRARSGLRTSTLAMVGHTWLRELPAALEVRGDLDLKGCANLAHLPAHLKVTGTLTLTGCTSLSEVPTTVEAKALVLPDGSAGPSHPPRSGLWSAVKATWWMMRALSQPWLTPSPPPGAVSADEARRAIVRGQRGVVVREDLRLADLPDLAALPQRLTVFGNLTLSALDGLEELPNDLRVVGSITVESCRSLRSLPALSVERLTIARCDALATLANLNAGTLALSSCQQLESIDASVTVTESLSVSHCARLNRLADGVPAQSLNLDDLPALQTVPHAPNAQSYYLQQLPLVKELPLSDVVSLLTIRHLPRLTELRPGLSLRRLEVRRCETLQALPPRLEVTGDFVLSGCPLVTVVPADTRTVAFHGEDLPALERIDAPWRDLSDLRLRQCGRLVALPATLQSVRGVVDLTDCVFVAALPARLAVTGGLNLTRCRSLQQLPEGLPPPLSLEVEGCGLQALPRTWSGIALTWGGTVMTARQLFNTEALTIDEILGEPDERRRRVLRERLGLARLVERASPEVVDEDVVTEGTRRLLRVATPFEPVVILEYCAVSDGPRLYWLAFPGATSCRDAARWVAHSSSSDEYDPILDQWR